MGRMIRYNVHLDNEQVARLKAMAEAKGCTAAELIRRYVDAGLDRDEKRREKEGAR